jgi:hypothetical protein
LFSLSAPATINGKEVFDLLRDDLVALENEFGRDTNIFALAGGSESVRRSYCSLQNF